MRDSAGTFTDVTQNKQADDSAAFPFKIAVFVTVLFLVLKLVRVGDTTISDVYGWSWWLVFSPLWGLAVLAAALAGVQVWGNKRKLRKAQAAENAVLLRMATGGKN